MSCGDIANALTAQFGPTVGFSERNVRRWCTERGLNNICPDHRLELEVEKGIQEVCLMFQWSYVQLFSVTVVSNDVAAAQFFSCFLTEMAIRARTMLSCLMQT